MPEALFRHLMTAGALAPAAPEPMMMDPLFPAAESEAEGE
jgi:hypothetical protein